MRPKIYLGLIVLVSVLVMACQMPAGFGTQRNLVGEGENPIPGTWTSGSLSVVLDEERGQAIFINENGERFDVSAVEYEGAPLIRCVQVESFTEVPSLDDPEALQIKALVTGTRDDGTLGAWEIHNDNTIHLTPGEDGQARCLDGTDSASVLDGMQTRWGWQYNVTGTATDGKVMIIVGYAVHARGFTYGSVQVLPGTSVGVYWKVWRLPYSRFCLISPPRIIGNLEQPNPHSRISLRLVQLKLFFFGRLESYLTVVNPSPAVDDFPATPAVRFDPLQRVYVVNGVENQDGVHAFAKIDANGGITILPAPPDLKLSPLSASSAKVEVDGELPVTVQITNAGVWPSEAGQLEWQILQGDTVKWSSDPEEVRPLVPLASRSFTLAFKSADKGLYRIVANLRGDLKELNYESHTQAIELDVEDNSTPPPPPPNGPYAVVIDMYNPTGPDMSQINWIMELYGPDGLIIISADSFHYLDSEHLFFPYINRTDIQAGVDYYVRVRTENPGDSWHYAIRLLKMVVDPEIVIEPRDAAWYFPAIDTPNYNDPAGLPYDWPPTAYQELKLGLEGKLNCYNSGGVTDDKPEVDWFHFKLP
jgi:hypothetical protein